MYRTWSFGRAWRNHYNVYVRQSNKYDSLERSNEGTAKMKKIISLRPLFVETLWLRLSIGVRKGNRGNFVRSKYIGHLGWELKLNSIFCEIWSIQGTRFVRVEIRGAFHDNFPGFSGFGFRRKLARTKTQQGTDKASEQYFRGLWSCLRADQQEWCQLRL